MALNVRKADDLSEPAPRRSGSRFSFVVSASAARVVVAVRGDVDLATARRLENVVVITAKRYRRPLVVDLADVTFFDCAGLTALLRARARIAPRFGRLTVVAARGPARLVLLTTGTDVVLLAHENRRVAMSRARHC